MADATWATLLATDDYLRGVQCLARGLRENSAFPLLILVTDAVSEQTRALLEKEPGCSVRLVSGVDIRTADGSRVYTLFVCHGATPRLAGTGHQASSCRRDEICKPALC
jgi:hypothetical protein